MVGGVGSPTGLEFERAVTLIFWLAARGVHFTCTFYLIYSSRSYVGRSKAEIQVGWIISGKKHVIHYHIFTQNIINRR
jgi:hypothetical protein